MESKLTICDDRGAIVSVGGPALTYWLTPTEEELRSRYNPDLLKQSIEKREEREQEFDEFVTRLKEYSKSDKPSWSPPPSAGAPMRAALLCTDERMSG